MHVIFELGAPRLARGITACARTRTRTSIPATAGTGLNMGRCECNHDSSHADMNVNALSAFVLMFVGVVGGGGTPSLSLGCTMGIPPGNTTHTRTRTSNGSIPAAAGMGLHAGTDFRTHGYALIQVALDCDSARIQRRT